MAERTGIRQYFSPLLFHHPAFAAGRIMQPTRPSLYSRKTGHAKLGMQNRPG